MNPENLKLLVASRLDVAEFLDIIGYTMFDLVEVLSSEVQEYAEELTKACDEY